MKRRSFLTAPFLCAAFLCSALAADNCSMCETWNQPQKPFRIFGNTYYVGPHGLSSILITSDAGHILIDGALAISAPQIIANIRELGFKPEDIRVLLNTHVHHDHAGGLAELQKISDAPLRASPASLPVLKSGGVDKDDPQFGDLLPIAPVPKLDKIIDNEAVHVGNVTVRAHLTSGHTPGGTSWTWDSCEGTRCRHMVFADSLTAVSADTYKFTAHPDVMESFQHSFAIVAALPCDIMVSTHPEFSGLWDRLAQRDSGEAKDLVDTDGCKRYAANARKGYDNRIAKERGN